MKFKTTVVVSVSVFVMLCAGLVTEAVLNHPQQAKALAARLVPLTSETAQPAPAATATEPAAQPVETAPAMTALVEYPTLNAHNEEQKTVRLGTVYDPIERTDDPEKFKFAVLLTTQGAAVDSVILSEFKQRSDTVADDEPAGLSADGNSGAKVLKPLTLLHPWKNGDNTIYSLANTHLWLAPAEANHFGGSAFPLYKLNWQLAESTETTARFEATLTDDSGDYGVKVIKTYHIEPGSYDLVCDLNVENLSKQPVKVLMKLQGPGGMDREAVREDGRKVKVAYHSGNAGIETAAMELVKMPKKIQKAENAKSDADIQAAAEAFQLVSKHENAVQAWSALTNKYFAAVVYTPQAAQGRSPWLQLDTRLYNASTTDIEEDHSCSYSLKSEVMTLGAASSSDAARSYSLAIYLGPKDKRIFENNDAYKALQFFQTIDFRACCCPTSVIAPLAFGIMWLMNTLYTLMGPLGNYGVVIIFLVFLVRLAMHPITKKSQVSMMKMQKLGPKMKEIQAKYANNKAEMNKQVMAMYREAGVSPVSGMLPMMLQMPIWIALWTAVYTSIDMRGAGFLPFWITDLSLPDRLFHLPFGLNLPLVGEYFNLLPILMGVVMFMQQKMMPSSQPGIQADSQMAQQQKMMMIMMPLMFPIMLYNGPAGVNLYIMSSTFAGVIEQKVIRKHIKEREELEAIGKVPVTSKTGGKVKKKKPKPFFKG